MHVKLILINLFHPYSVVRFHYSFEEQYLTLPDLRVRAKLNLYLTYTFIYSCSFLNLGLSGLNG